jgi:hypothetical protein
MKGWCVFTGRRRTMNLQGGREENATCSMFMHERKLGSLSFFLYIYTSGHSGAAVGVMPSSLLPSYSMTSLLKIKCIILFCICLNLIFIFLITICFVFYVFFKLIFLISLQNILFHLIFYLIRLLFFLLFFFIIFLILSLNI